MFKVENDEKDNILTNEEDYETRRANRIFAIQTKYEMVNLKPIFLAGFIKQI